MFQAAISPRGIPRVAGGRSVARTRWPVVDETLCQVDMASLGSALDAPTKPVTVLVGPAGSGKTEIAVNLALAWRGRGAQVSLVDLDLVKPFFRCRQAIAELEERGIRLVAPTGERFYADLPILLPEARSAAAEADPHARLIFDVGGDDLGARALGSLADLLDRKGTDLLFVVNTNRPFAGDLPALRGGLARIQTAARLAVTGLVANTHLMQETTPAMVQDGIRAARALGAATGIPVRFCAVLAALAPALASPGGLADPVDILALERHILPPFLPRPGGTARRPAVV